MQRLLLWKTYWCLAGNGWEWGNGMIITSDYGSFPHSLLSTSKNNLYNYFGLSWWDVPESLHKPTSSYTNELLHTPASTQTNCSTNQLLHKPPFAPTNFYKPVFTQISFYTNQLLHKLTFRQTTFYANHLLHQLYTNPCVGPVSQRPRRNAEGC